MKLLGFPNWIVGLSLVLGILFLSGIGLQYFVQSLALSQQFPGSFIVQAYAPWNIDSGEDVPAGVIKYTPSTKNTLPLVSQEQFVFPVVGGGGFSYDFPTFALVQPREEAMALVEFSVAQQSFISDIAIREFGTEDRTPPFYSVMRGPQGTFAFTVVPSLAGLPNPESYFETEGENAGYLRKDVTLPEAFLPALYIKTIDDVESRRVGTGMALAFSPDETMLLMVHEGQVSVVDLKTDQKIPLYEYGREVTTVKASPDGRTLALGSNATITMFTIDWQSASLIKIAEIPGASRFVFNQSGTRLATIHTFIDETTNEIVVYNVFNTDTPVHYATYIPLAVDVVAWNENE